MGLFRRKASEDESRTPAPQGADGPEAPQETAAAPGADATSEAAGADGADDARRRGPFDASETVPAGPRVDLGAVRLPLLPGLELRMEIDKKTQKVTGASVALNGSGLQVQAFAAPRTEGIWDEIRAEIATSVTGQGGMVDDIPGPFGRELLARLPAQGPDGQKGFRPARFVGVDGPRWFLRGVLTGRAAVDPEAARPLESVFANIVVVRDNSPRPPRDLLALTLPDQKGAPAAAAPEGAAPSTPSFDPLTRGPEITEIR